MDCRGQSSRLFGGRLDGCEVSNQTRSSLAIMSVAHGPVDALDGLSEPHAGLGNGEVYGRYGERLDDGDGVHTLLAALSQCPAFSRLGLGWGGNRHRDRRFGLFVFGVDRCIINNGMVGVGCGMRGFWGAGLAHFPARIDPAPDKAGSIRGADALERYTGCCHNGQ